MPQSGAWPTELRLLEDGRLLRVSFDSGAVYALPAEYMRVFSPSAEVRGHGEQEHKTVGGKRNVRIAGLSMVGNYAVRPVFDDGHDSGLFTWSYLRQLGAAQESNFAHYLAALAAKGLDRDRPGEA